MVKLIRQVQKRWKEQYGYEPNVFFDLLPALNSGTIIVSDEEEQAIRAWTSEVKL